MRFFSTRSKLRSCGCETRTRSVLFPPRFSTFEVGRDEIHGSGFRLLSFTIAFPKTSTHVSLPRNQAHNATRNADPRDPPLSLDPTSGTRVDRPIPRSPAPQEGVPTSSPCHCVVSHLTTTLGDLLFGSISPLPSSPLLSPGYKALDPHWVLKTPMSWAMTRSRPRSCSMENARIETSRREREEEGTS